MVAVVDHNGRPVENATVTLSSGDACYGPKGCEAQVDAGKECIPHVWSCGENLTGDLSIEVVAPGYTASERTVEIEGDPKECDAPITESIVVRLDPE